MGKRTPIAELVAVAGSFGPASAAAKRRLLDEIVRGRPGSRRELAPLHEVLGFLRAYPDDAHVLRAVEAVIGALRGWFAAAGMEADAPPLADTGLPGSVVRGEFSLPLLRRMNRALPGCVEIDWGSLEADEPLLNALGLLLTGSEGQGLDDIGIGTAEWFAACRPASCPTDLAFLMELFDRSPLAAAARDVLFDSCGLTARYSLAEPGTGRCEIAWPVERIHYQRKPLDREWRSIAAAVRQPLPAVRRLPAGEGERFVGFAQRTLAARGLEIRTLSYANARDVSVARCGRGVDIALIGVVPEYRDPLESHYCSFVLQNGVPIGYGPSTVSLGCCEIGLNLFPEFRGAEVRFLYPQFTRVLHHVLGAQYFFLTPYGMGEDNPAAIRTGAFWFYRRLGFRPTNPEVECLAQDEEQRMTADPRHRSSAATLRRLSHTFVYLDLSGGACRPLDLGGIGMRQSRFLARIEGGNRARALARCLRQVSRVLGRRKLRTLGAGERRAWELWAPILAAIPDLARWGAREKGRIVEILRRKGSISELGVDRLLCAHERLRRALQTL
ncbi:MAG: hypothetical protein AB1726_15980 [Planctomycetota bacterium]